MCECLISHEEMLHLLLLLKMTLSMFFAILFSLSPNGCCFVSFLFALLLNALSLSLSLSLSLT